jgi:diaminohydroxyphosphoribosylaminopyrimidine deaminase/5-amino-6-(5-phosphoribosylamino)uracil reductase
MTDPDNDTDSQAADADAHAHWMREALWLAADAVALSEPNPRVGCLIVAADGTVIGRGHTQQAGGPHAEVMALRDAAAHGHSVRGATVIVTLEPCAHHGRTPPCCDALVQAGVGRVVMAIEDPNPRVAGQGAARLRAAGIEVIAGVEADAAYEMNIGFFSRMQRGRPWVRLKVAASLDGRTALNDGRSQWITSEAARADGHAFRRRAGAVLTGSGTLIHDDPQLDVRLVPTPRQPLRVVLDSQLRSPLTARMFQQPDSVLVYAARPPADRLQAFTAHGIEVADMPDAQGQVDLTAVLADLAQRGINELHVEAGGRLNGSLVREGLVDEYLIYLAPKLLGSGLDMAAFGPLDSLAHAPLLRFHDIERVGCDVRILARPLVG